MALVTTDIELQVDGDDAIQYLGQFESGDVCWAKSGKRGEPWWPSQVVDLRVCPPNVLKFAKAKHLCVAFFGEDTERQFAWVDPSRIAVWDDMLLDMQSIALARKFKEKFGEAMSEAHLVYLGFSGGINGQLEDLFASGSENAMADIVLGPTCHSCGVLLDKAKDPGKDDGKSRAGKPELCKMCKVLHKKGQYCVVCDAVWLPNDDDDWIQCDDCGMWVHAHCDGLNREALQTMDTQGLRYECPKCREKIKNKSKNRSKATSDTNTEENSVLSLSLEETRRKVVELLKNKPKSKGLSPYQIFTKRFFSKHSKTPTVELEKLAKEADERMNERDPISSDCHEAGAVVAGLRVSNGELAHTEQLDNPTSPEGRGELTPPQPLGSSKTESPAVIASNSGPKWDKLPTRGNSSGTQSSMDGSNLSLPTALPQSRIKHEHPVREGQPLEFPSDAFSVPVAKDGHQVNGAQEWHAENVMRNGAQMDRKGSAFAYPGSSVMNAWGQGSHPPCPPSLSDQQTQLAIMARHLAQQQTSNNMQQQVYPAMGGLHPMQLHQMLMMQMHAFEQMHRRLPPGVPPPLLGHSAREGDTPMQDGIGVLQRHPPEDQSGPYPHESPYTPRSANGGNAQIGDNSSRAVEDSNKQSPVSATVLQSPVVEASVAANAGGELYTTPDKREPAESAEHPKLDQLPTESASLRDPKQKERPSTNRMNIMAKILGEAWREISEQERSECNEASQNDAHRVSAECVAWKTEMEALVKHLKKKHQAAKRNAMRREKLAKEKEERLRKEQVDIAGLPIEEVKDDGRNDVIPAVSTNIQPPAQDPGAVDASEAAKVPQTEADNDVVTDTAADLVDGKVSIRCNDVTAYFNVRKMKVEYGGQGISLTKFSEQAGGKGPWMKTVVVNSSPCEQLLCEWLRQAGHKKLPPAPKSLQWETMSVEELLEAAAKEVASLKIPVVKKVEPIKGNAELATDRDTSKALDSVGKDTKAKKKKKKKEFAEMAEKYRNTEDFERFEYTCPAERCDVCYRDTDEDCNIFVTCSCCGINVHQLCYGVTDEEAAADFWTCTCCLWRQEIQRELQEEYASTLPECLRAVSTAITQVKLPPVPPCELCPFIGGALKPTKHPCKWAHITCASYVRETSIVDVDSMEPIAGVRKAIEGRPKRLECVLCGQDYGACIQCSYGPCYTAYHTLCARNAGFKMEPRARVKGTKEIIEMMSFCAEHRDCESNGSVRPPKRSALRRVKASKRKRAPIRSSTEGGEEKAIVGDEGNEVAVSDAKVHSTSVDEESRENDQGEYPDEMACSRLLSFQKMRELRQRQKEATVDLARKIGVHKLGATLYEIGGVQIRHESAPQDLTLRPRQRRAVHATRDLEFASEGQNTNVDTIAGKVQKMRDTEYVRLRFGRSPIHGWGIFPACDVSRNTMLIDYRGELVRMSVSNRREKRYQANGREATYLFAIDESWVIDSTKKGNIARFFNHSCDPNCMTKIVEVEGVKKIVFVTIKNVRKGEELTYDYRFAAENKWHKCYCGASNCRGWMG